MMIPLRLFCNRRTILFRNFNRTCASNTKLTLESNIQYPKSDEKFGRYLDSLVDNQINMNDRKSFPLKTITDQYEYRKSIIAQLKELQETMSNECNEELIKMGVEELANFTEELKTIDDVLLKNVLNLHNDHINYKSIVMEVRAGVGGKEAALFTSELFEMYQSYLIYKKFNFNIIDEDDSEIGGLRHGSLLIHDKNAFDLLKFEAGVHRVQRIPKTEKSGRIHTSTAIVSVVPCPDELNINLNLKELRIETKRASGPGGQNVNKLESAVRIVHIPTGIAVECQEERYQFKNKEIAMEKLKNKLYKMELDNQMSEMNSTKKAQTGTGLGLRNEKLRTYNYQQSRITDHRLDGRMGTVHNLEEFMKGGYELDLLIEKLQNYENIRSLNDIIRDY